MKTIFSLLITLLGSIQLPINAQETDKQNDSNSDKLYAFFLNKKGDCTIKKSEIISTDLISVNTLNFDSKSNAQIASFDIELILNKDLVTLKANSASFTPQMKEAMRKTINNSRIYITNIKAKMPDGTIMKLPDINIRVVI